jgi:hypothetical protein
MPTFLKRWWEGFQRCHGHLSGIHITERREFPTKGFGLAQGSNSKMRRPPPLTGHRNSRCSLRPHSRWRPTASGWSSSEHVMAARAAPSHFRHDCPFRGPMPLPRIQRLQPGPGLPPRHPPPFGCRSKLQWFQVQRFGEPSPFASLSETKLPARWSSSKVQSMSNCQDHFLDALGPSPIDLRSRNGARTSG